MCRRRAGTVAATRPCSTRLTPTPRLRKAPTAPSLHQRSSWSTMLSSRWVSRRELLSNTGCGFGLLALADLLASGVPVRAAASLDRSAQPYAVRPPHYTSKARQCIFLYMPGGPSHIDLFDPKPRVAAMNGQPLPFEKPRLERVKTGNLLASPWKFKKQGECGTEISELLPLLATHADDLRVTQ